MPLEYLCDNDLDCGDDDQSDEMGCYNNRTIDVQGRLTCESNSTICAHNCTDFPQHNGFFCSCHRGYTMEKVDATAAAAGISHHTCIDVDECGSLAQNMCAQRCTNTKGSFKCGCGGGYLDSRGDGTICEADSAGEDAVVLLAYGSDMRQIRQNLSEYVYSSLVEREAFISAVDIDPFER